MGKQILRFAQDDERLRRISRWACRWRDIVRDIRIRVDLVQRYDVASRRTVQAPLRRRVRARRKKVADALRLVASQIAEAPRTEEEVASLLFTQRRHYIVGRSERLLATNGPTSVHQCNRRRIRPGRLGKDVLRLETRGELDLGVRLQRQRISWTRGKRRERARRIGHIEHRELIVSEYRLRHIANA